MFPPPALCYTGEKPRERQRKGDSYGGKKNERYPLEITGYGSAGEGVARLAGQAVFVKGALQGERCQVQLLKVGKQAAWGRVEQVLTLARAAGAGLSAVSPVRRVPAAAHDL